MSLRLRGRMGAELPSPYAGDYLMALPLQGGAMPCGERGAATHAPAFAQAAGRGIKRASTPLDASSASPPGARATGPALGAVVDGCPPGLTLSEGDIQPFLDKRRPGQSRFTTQRQEPDQVRILSGIFEGRTTGTPIALRSSTMSTSAPRTIRKSPRPIVPAMPIMPMTRNTAFATIAAAAGARRARRRRGWRRARWRGW